jgi:uncharacterized membrane protein
MLESIGTKTPRGHEFYLKRNCSISPKQLAYVFLALGSISVLIGYAFFLLGASLILPFSFVEVFALLTAYFYNAIHANDYECLVIDREYVHFEAKYGTAYREEKLLKSMTRIFPSENKNLINIWQGQKNIIFGRHIHLNHRPILEKEIKILLNCWE